MLKVLQRVWVPLLIVVVVLLAIFMVDRLRGVFGKTELTRPGAGLVNDPAPFNPKEVKYEIFGQPGTVATINYLDLDAQPQKAVNASLPWSLDLTTTAPAASPTSSRRATVTASPAASRSMMSSRTRRRRPG